MKTERRVSGTVDRRQLSRDRRWRPGGVLWAKLMDPGGAVEVEDLTETGLHDAIYQAELLIEQCRAVLGRRRDDDENLVYDEEPTQDFLNHKENP